MPNQCKKADLKIKNLENQLTNKQKRIDELNTLRKQNQERQHSKKQNTPDITDNLFLDIFSILKLG